MDRWLAQDIGSGSDAGESQNDIEARSNDIASPMCPICIHEIEPSQNVISLPSCNHRFHSRCLVQWLCTHTRDCPYCRTEIITQEMLERAYRQRQ